MIAQTMIISNTLSLTSAIHMGGHRHAPTALPTERYPVRGWVGTTAGLDGCGKSLPPPELDPRTVQPVASRYTD